MKAASLLVPLVTSLILGSSAFGELILDENFSSTSLPAGWSISATTGAQYRYSTGSGLTFTDAAPVSGSNTAIVASTDGQRATVNFLYQLPYEIQDFEASFSFTWDQTVGLPQNGVTSPIVATDAIYLALYNQSSNVARAGFYDNARTEGPAYSSYVNSESQSSAWNTVPFTSSGINTLTIRRVDGVLRIEWIDDHGQLLFDRSETNNTAIDRLYLQFSMLRVDASGVGTTKFGAFTVHQVTLNTIPEPGTLSLLTGAAAFGLFFARKRLLSA